MSWALLLLSHRTWPGCFLIVKASCAGEAGRVAFPAWYWALSTYPSHTDSLRGADTPFSLRSLASTGDMVGISWYQSCASPLSSVLFTDNSHPFTDWSGACVHLCRAPLCQLCCLEAQSVPGYRWAPPRSWDSGLPGGTVPSVCVWSERTGAVIFISISCVWDYWLCLLVPFCFSHTPSVSENSLHCDTTQQWPYPCVHSALKRLEMHCLCLFLLWGNIKCIIFSHFF